MEEHKMSKSKDYVVQHRIPRSVVEDRAFDLAAYIRHLSAPSDADYPRNFDTLTIKFIVFDSEVNGSGTSNIYTEPTRADLRNGLAYDAVYTTDEIDGDR
jgi:hypothetical protein